MLRNESDSPSSTPAAISSSSSLRAELLCWSMACLSTCGRLACFPACWPQRPDCARMSYKNLEFAKEGSIGGTRVLVFACIIIWSAPHKAVPVSMTSCWNIPSSYFPLKMRPIASFYFRISYYRKPYQRASNQKGTGLGGDNNNMNNK